MLLQVDRRVKVKQISLISSPSISPNIHSIQRWLPSLHHSKAIRLENSIESRRPATRIVVHIIELLLLGFTTNRSQTTTARVTIESSLNSTHLWHKAQSLIRCAWQGTQWDRNRIFKPAKESIYLSFDVVWLEFVWIFADFFGVMLWLFVIILRVVKIFYFIFVVLHTSVYLLHKAIEIAIFFLMSNFWLKLLC